MRPEVGPLSGQSADARDGGARPSGSPAGSRTEEGQEDQETQGQCTGIGSAGKTQTYLWGGSDLDRWHPCDDGADHPLGDRHGHECLPNREPLCLVVRADSEQRYQRGESNRAGTKESAEPGCHGATHGGHHAVEECELLGGQISAPTQTVALQGGGGQGDGPPSSG